VNYSRNHVLARLGRLRLKDAFSRYDITHRMIAAGGLNKPIFAQALKVPANEKSIAAAEDAFGELLRKADSHDKWVEWQMNGLITEAQYDALLAAQAEDRAFNERVSESWHRRFDVPKQEQLDAKTLSGAEFEKKYGKQCPLY